MVRKVTQAKFEEWAKVPGNIEGVLELIADGLTLQKTAVKLKQPYMCLYPLFHNGGAWEKQYNDARKAWADKLQDEALEIADNAPVDEKAGVMKAKLRVETRQNQAKAYHRERWGERVQVDKTITVDVDAGLLGKASDLLKLVKQQPRVIEGETIPALPVKEDGSAD